MAFSLPEYFRLFAQKKATKGGGGSRAPQDPPYLRPCERGKPQYRSKTHEINLQNLIFEREEREIISVDQIGSNC